MICVDTQREEASVSDAERRIRELIEEIGREGDPERRTAELSALLKAMPEVHSRVRELRQAAVVDWHASGASYQVIGHRLGIERQRAWQIAKGIRNSRGQLGGDEED